MSHLSIHPASSDESPDEDMDRLLWRINECLEFNTFHRLINEYLNFKLYFTHCMKGWSVITDQLWRSNYQTLDRPMVRLSGDTPRSLGKRMRSKFVKGMTVGPPEQFRVIDCKSTMEEQKVVLIDWHRRKVPYTAVSHTFGMEVYSVFDCECAAKCRAEALRSTGKPCSGHQGDAHSKIVGDVLNMCRLLRAAGAQYVWHDGVCIAQHNDAEVTESLKHMGWIYGHAKETVIFLHYIGSPMAPIRHNGELVSRWGNRVWTLQEAALSARRRYCVRIGGDLRHCRDLQQLEEEIGRWYEDDSSIAVVEEDEYMEVLRKLSYALVSAVDPWKVSSYDAMEKCLEWQKCLGNLTSTCMDTCVQFPTIETALSLCSLRQCKHEGDRINSILALAGVTDFVAPKEGNIKNSTIEFFTRQGQKGLGRAVFSANLEWGEGQEDSWVPSLSRQLQPIQTDYLQSIYESMSSTLYPRKKQIKKLCVGSADFIRYEVLANGMIQLSGDPLVCMPVELRFTHANLGARDAEDGRREGGQKGGEVMGMDLGYVQQDTGFQAYAEGCNVVLGKADLATLDGRPMIEGRAMKEGDTVSVCLVYAAPALQFARHAHSQEHKLLPLLPPPEFGSMLAVPFPHLLFSVPALLIKGHQLLPAVSKLGHFYIFPSLQEVLLNCSSPYQPTFLHNLVLT